MHTCMCVHVCFICRWWALFEYAALYIHVIAGGFGTLMHLVLAFFRQFMRVSRLDMATFKGSDYLNDPGVCGCIMCSLCMCMCMCVCVYVDMANVCVYVDMATFKGSDYLNDPGVCGCIMCSLCVCMCMCVCVRV